MSIGAVSGGVPDFSSMRAQFEEQRAARFEKADADGNGGLTLEEFGEAAADSPLGSANAAGTSLIEEIFSSLDADGNGEVTQAEFASAKPPTAAGDFSPEALSGLLAAQEESESSSIISLLSSASEQYGSSETDLIGELLDTLGQSEDE